MALFRSRGKEGNQAAQREVPEAVVTRLDSALTSVFSENGKRTVLYYMSNRYGLTLEQASVDPSKLEKALTSLLGEVGWMVVKREILQEFWDRKIPMEDQSVIKGASLREAFSAIRFPKLDHLVKPY